MYAHRSKRMPPRPPRRAAFTLIELLVVIAILGLLLSLLVPSLGLARETARRTLCRTNLYSLGQAFAFYTYDHEETYPAAEDPVSIDPFYWLWMGRGWRGLLVEYVSGQTGRDSLLYCKSDPAEEKYEATSYAYSMAFYHSPAQIDSLNSPAETYSNPLPTIAQQLGDVLEPDRKVLLGEWTSNHDPVDGDSGWWCWEGTRTYLFADGAVRYLPATDILPARDDLPDPNLTIGGVRGRDY